MRNVILNTVCALIAVSGIWWTASYFWRYFNYEITNDAFVDQYVAPLNIRATGYIRECASRSTNWYIKEIRCWFWTTANT